MPVWRACLMAWGPILLVLTLLHLPGLAQTPAPAPAAPADPLAISASEHLTILVQGLRRDRDRLELDLTRAIGNLEKAKAKIAELEKALADVKGAAEGKATPTPAKPAKPAEAPRP
jgi:hypothetical protein